MTGDALVNLHFARLRQLPDLERLELIQTLRVSVEESSDPARHLLAQRWNIGGTDEERSELASALYDDLFPGTSKGEQLDERSNDAGDLHPEWDAELARRITEIEDGTAQLIPAEEVWAEMERRWGVRRRA